MNEEEYLRRWHIRLDRFQYFLAGLVTGLLVSCYVIWVWVY